MGWPELPDKWTYKPVWCPPYPIPFGFWGNLMPFYTKKEVLAELSKEPKKKKYLFFDTPDYEDCHKKVYTYGVYGMRTSAIVAIMDVLANKQLSYLTAFGRASGHFGRIGGSFLMYAAITCCTANLRGKVHDSWYYPINHIIGGASVGLIWGYKYRSTGIGAAVAAAGALFGILNLRAHTPTECHPTGWVVMFPKNIEDIREENGTLGGKNYRDMYLGYKLTDPGRRGLE